MRALRGGGLPGIIHALTRMEPRVRFVLSCLRACGLTLAAGAFGLPMVLLLAASTHAPGSVPVPGDIWPDSPGIAAYFTAFEQVPMARALLNSVVLLLLFVPTALVTGSLGGFGIRLMSPRWQLIAIALLVAAASVPMPRSGCRVSCCFSGWAWEEAGFRCGRLR